MRVTHWTALEAAAAVKARRLITPAAAAGKAEQAAGDTVGLLGVSGSRDVAAAETVEVAVTGIADVVYGGAVARGDLLTADADGRAVKLAVPGIVLAHAAGAARATDIDVTGIETTDLIVGVAVTDGTDPGAVTVQSDGHIRCANATAGKHLIVSYRRPRHSVGIALEAGAADDIGTVMLAPGVL